MIAMLSSVKRSKYVPLYWHLTTFPSQEWPTTFKHVESILEFQLPNAARKWPAWWANDPTHVEARAWLAAGWETSDVDMQSERVTFKRVRPSSSITHMDSQGDNDLAYRMAQDKDFIQGVERGLLDIDQGRYSTIEDIKRRLSDL